MKYFVILTFLWCSSCMMVKGRYIFSDHGEEGFEFWDKNYTFTAGDNATIPCPAKAKPGKSPLTFVWQIDARQAANKKFGEANLVSFTGGRLQLLKRFGIPRPKIINYNTIVLNNLTRYSSGVYKCAVITQMRVNNKMKTYIERAYMNMEIKASAKIVSKMETSIVLISGSKLDLDCTSNGNPTPTITWSRTDGRPFPKGRTGQHSKGFLSVENVGQTDRGNYKCVSSNSLGKDTKTFSVNVKVSAEIITKGNSYATIGEDGVVKCEAIGVPPPTFSWKWRKNNARYTLNEQVKTNDRFTMETKHTFEKSVSYLRIKDVQLSDLRDYDCTAKNEDYATLSIPLKRHTKPATPRIQNVAPRGNELTVSWRFGNNGGKKITVLVIEYALVNSSDWKNITIKNPSTLYMYTIKDLLQQKLYTIRLYAVNEIGSSPPSDQWIGNTQLADRQHTVLQQPGPGQDDQVNPALTQTKAGLDMTVMVVGVAGGFLVLIIAIVIVCILMRNIQRNSAKKTAENAERVAQSANQDTATALINFLQHGGERLSTTPASVACSGDTLQLTTSNKWEFPRERLVLQNILGSGAFGIVMKAEADGINGFNSGTIPVAVKFVKENESASAKKDLVAELELLKLIEPHTNVINLLGCCTRSEPLMVIVEYCAYGDLQSFLRSSRGIRDPYYIDCYKRPSSRLTSKELLMFGTQISRGMAHLATLKVIHRDLAARNILVDENKVCKVSDFGFARDIYVEDHYTRKTAGGRFPIKWMAIESLLDGISTTKSDVWSFAIVLWEIITLGASPYPGMNSQEVVSFLQNGMRMDKPKHCSDDLYNLLLDCWQVASHRRPNFEMLARYLDTMYNNDYEYINMRTYDDHLYINFDGNTISGGSNSATLPKEDSTSSQLSQKSHDSS